MTKNEKYIVDMYVRYFGRAADAATIATYAEDKKTSVILKNIIADADAEKAELGTEEFVNNAFQNLFGRNATTKEMNKYSKVLDKGKDLPINSIVKSATKTDKAVYDNKIAVAVKYAELGGTEPLDLSKISKGNLIELNFLNTVTKSADLQAKVGALAGNSGIPSSFDGKTFVLTTIVDAGKDFTGTTKNDLFIADNSGSFVTATAADTLDGGKGEDTFKLYADPAVTTKAAELPTLKNIENVALYNLLDGDFDAKKWDTVETLYVVSTVAAGTVAAGGFQLGKKVTTVNFEDIAVDQVVTFDKDLTAATVGVNNVTAATAPTITVDSAATGALKTLTINAYGKKSDFTLEQAADTIETLNITGKADLTLAYAAAGTSKIVTIDGSEAEGKLDLDLDGTNAATLKTVKTGTGDDTVNLGSTAGITVASGTTIDLGAGNDKLVAGTGGKIAAGSIIDGGAGIDSLDAALVNAGNAGVFKVFETISLNAATTLDLDLLTKSTITTIAKDDDKAHTLSNVKKSQSLKINTDASTLTSITTLNFKASEIAGTADAYTINFAKDAVASAGNTVDAGTVTINGIETVTVNSTGKTTTTKNIIKLDDADAKSLVITGDKDIDVTFTAFGKAGGDATNGKGVATIDASAATGAVNINTAAVNVAFNGITIKGGAGKDKIDMTNLVVTATTGDKIIVNAGAGDDEIIVGAKGGILTGGAGKDTFNIANSKANTELTEAAGIVKVTITDLTAGDTIKFANGAAATEVFNKIQINVDGASNLDAALTTVFGVDAATPANGIINWFQFAGNTYIVEDVTTGATAGANDIVVKINGLVNLANSTFDGTAAAADLTIA